MVYNFDFYNVNIYLDKEPRQKLASFQYQTLGLSSKTIGYSFQQEDSISFIQESEFPVDVQKYFTITISPQYDKINKDLFIKDSKKQKKIRAVKVKHGKVQAICYIIDKKLAYISDVSEIHTKDFRYFNNLKYLIIDCLWYRNHPSHLNLDTCLKLIKIFSPKKAILTNLHIDLDYFLLLLVQMNQNLNFLYNCYYLF